MKQAYGEFIKSKDEQYASLVDEYRRIKYFRYSEKFKIDSSEALFNLLLESFKHMFKIKRELSTGLKFGHKVKNVHADYTISELDLEAHYLRIEWDVEGDKYDLEFQVKKTSKPNVFKLKFRQYIKRGRTFFGMADYAGIVLYKRAFKDNMKTFVNHIKYLQAGDYSKETIIFTYSKKFQNLDQSQLFDYVFKGFKQIYKLKGNPSEGLRFKFASENAYLNYTIKTLDKSNKVISIVWENEEMENSITLSISNNGSYSSFNAERTITCSSNVFKIPGHSKPKLYKSVFNESMNEITKYVKYLLKGNAELLIDNKDASIEITNPSQTKKPNSKKVSKAKKL
ncbi:MAG: hypothetical protein ACRC4M_02770 [Mycoplasma sp.]